MSNPNYFLIEIRELADRWHKRAAELGYDSPRGRALKSCADDLKEALRELAAQRAAQMPL